MWTILKIELFKIFKRPRTYISFVAISAIVFLIQLALYLDGDTYVSFMLQSINETFDVNGNIMNGYLICYVVLQLLLIHVPLLIILVGADMTAGEANMGTLRLITSRPISRFQLMMGKFLATAIYTLILLLWMAFLALLVSVLVFGTGDMLIFKSEQVVILRKADILWRYVAAFGFAAIAMLTVASLAFLLSIFAENSIGPIVATMSVIIVCTILTTMDLPLFNSLAPFLFTSHMLGWKGFFDDPVNYEAIFRSAGILLFHIFLFVGASVFIFQRKDILS